MNDERHVAIKHVLLPKDMNPVGTVFGGVILAHIDMAALVEARRAAPLRFVTRAMREVEFKEPVYVGDTLTYFTRTLSVGRTSIAVHVVVEAERWRADQGEAVQVTEAEVVLVAVDEHGRKRPIGG
ncbi:MAG: acyl-CoA thioesterase [Vicinamibacteria bacterium]|nr:acyl-CoA thioesterase [Vicinamibacteria bacterium]